MGLATGVPRASAASLRGVKGCALAYDTVLVTSADSLLRCEAAGECEDEAAVVDLLILRVNMVGAAGSLASEG